MAVFKRKGFQGPDDNYYFKFRFEGRQIMQSTGTNQIKLARQMEINERVRLKKESQTPESERPLPPAPTLAAFIELPEGESAGGQFWVEHGSSAYKKATTRAFYEERTRAVLLYEPLATARLSEIKKGMIDRFITHCLGTGLTPATVNRNLALLKLALNKAKLWDVIRDVPEFPNKKTDARLKERKRGRVVSPEEERIYMAAVNEDHQDFTSILIDTAMEPGPAAALDWSDVHFGANGKFKKGFIHDRCTKTETRERDLPMTDRLVPVLKKRWLAQGRPKSGPVFPSDRGARNAPTPLSTFQSVHKRLWAKTETRAAIGIKYFRLYDLRHTCLTRLRDAGADAFDLMLFAGWASTRMADNYIHVDDASKVRAAARLDLHIESGFGLEVASS